MVDDLPALAAQAPASATLVVFHTSVMYQVSAPRRQAFAEVVRGLPGHWIANEDPNLLPYGTLPKLPSEALHHVLEIAPGTLDNPGSARKHADAGNVRSTDSAEQR